jgi:hypothetical protein
MKIQAPHKSITSKIHYLSREEKAAGILLFVALLLGTAIRLVHTAATDFPLNDGGLFYTMTRDLQANGFLIPQYTTYNQSELPFAYPPLGFYLAGGLNSLFGLDLLSLMRWLPFFFNVLTILVFYLFAKRFFRDPIKAGIAVLFFALLQPGYEWLIMGGGLTRSPAMLFSLVALERFLALLEAEKRRWRDLLLVSLFYALTIQSHLEIGWFTTYSFALLWFFRGRSKRNFLSSVYIAFFTLLFTSPYWIQVIGLHSLQPFLAGLFSGGYSPFLSVFELFFFNFTEEMIFPVLALLALTGVVICFVKREYILPVWLVLNAILDARSVNRSDTIPAALLISIALVEGLFVLIEKHSRDKTKVMTNYPGENVLFTRPGILIIYLLIIQVALSAYLGKYMDQALSNSLTKSDRQAMMWIRENSPSNVKFFSLPASTWWETDAVSEWFPALTGRNNVTTVQGTEWRSDYRENIAKYKELVKRIKAGTISLADIQQKFPGIDYIYLPLTKYQDTAELLGIREALRGLPLIYRNDAVEIYQTR